MQSKQKTLIIVSAILLIAIFTNPNQAEHKEKVKSIINTFYKEKLKENKTSSNNGFNALGNLLGTTFINTMVENAVSCDNYFLFSVTKINHEGKEKSIGFGVLGNVFLSSKIEEAFNK